jgi:hypothetical protein
MEAIDKLKSQIENLLKKLNSQREENSEMRNRLIKVETDNRVKDEYIKALENKLSSLDSKG